MAANTSMDTRVGSLPWACSLFLPPCSSLESNFCRNLRCVLYTDHSVPAFTEMPVQRWLLEKNRDDMARAVVYRLHGVSTPETKAEAEAEFIDMQSVIKAEVSQRSNRLSDLWETRAMLRRTLVAVGVQVFGQFSGINGTSLVHYCVVFRC